MGGSKAEVQRARDTLRELIELSGMSLREVKKRLAAQSSDADLSRLLSGRLELKFRHILDINRVLGIHPLEFFRIVFKEPEQRSPFLQRLENLIGPGGTRAGGRAPRIGVPERDLDEFRQRLSRLAREVEQLKAAANQSRAK